MNPHTWETHTGNAQNKEEIQKKRKKTGKKEKGMIVKIAQTLIVVVNKAPNHAFLMSFKSEWKDQKRIQNRE